MWHRDVEKRWKLREIYTGGMRSERREEEATERGGKDIKMEMGRVGEVDKVGKGFWRKDRRSKSQRVFIVQERKASSIHIGGELVLKMCLLMLTTTCQIPS